MFSRTYRQRTWLPCESLQCCSKSIDIDLKGHNTKGELTSLKQTLRPISCSERKRQQISQNLSERRTFSDCARQARCERVAAFAEADLAIEQMKAEAVSDPSWDLLGGKRDNQLQSRYASWLEQLKRLYCSRCLRCAEGMHGRLDQYPHSPYPLRPHLRSLPEPCVKELPG